MKYKIILAKISEEKEPDDFGHNFNRMRPSEPLFEADLKPDSAIEIMKHLIDLARYEELEEVDGRAKAVRPKPL